MDKEKETKVEAEVKEEPVKEEPKKAEPKKKASPKKAEPKADKKSFVERKLKAINSMSNAFLAKAQAERLMSRR